MASSSSRKTPSDPAAVFPQESSDRLLEWAENMVQSVFYLEGGDDAAEELVGHGDSFGTSESSILGDSDETKFRIIPSLEVPLPDTGMAEGFWGPFIPTAPALVLLAGESSAGKTVLGYNLAYHLSEGREWAGLTPPQQLRVLYVDLESPEVTSRQVV